MKTKTILFIAIPIILALTIFGAYISFYYILFPYEGEPSSITAQYTDLTAKINGFDPTFKKIVNTTTSISEYDFILKDISENYDATQNAVYGKVYDINYWDEDGQAWIIYDFLIEKSYKGNLKAGDMISIMAGGGYVRLSKEIENRGTNAKKGGGVYTEQEIQDSITHVLGEGEHEPKAGDKYLVFLTDRNDLRGANEIYPAMAYKEFFGYMSRYIEKEGSFERYSPQNENYYNEQPQTLPQFEAKLAAFVNQ